MTTDDVRLMDRDLDRLGKEYIAESLREGLSLARAVAPRMALEPDRCCYALVPVDAKEDSVYRFERSIGAISGKSLERVAESFVAIASEVGGVVMGENRLAQGRR